MKGKLRENTSTLGIKDKENGIMTGVNSDIVHKHEAATEKRPGNAYFALFYDAMPGLKDADGYRENSLLALISRQATI